MPTPSGKPRRGERIALTDDLGDTYQGTVLERYDGLCWGLKVKWDSGEVKHLGEAEWFARRGKLKVIGKEKS